MGRADRLDAGRPAVPRRPERPRPSAQSCPFQPASLRRAEIYFAIVAVPSKYAWYLGHEYWATARPSFKPSMLSAWMWYLPITREMPAMSAVAVNVGSKRTTSLLSGKPLAGCPSVDCMASTDAVGSVH